MIFVPVYLITFPSVFRFYLKTLFYHCLLAAFVLYLTHILITTLQRQVKPLAPSWVECSCPHCSDTTALIIFHFRNVQFLNLWTNFYAFMVLFPWFLNFICELVESRHEILFLNMFGLLSFIDKDPDIIIFPDWILEPWLVLSSDLLCSSNVLVSYIWIISLFPVPAAILTQYALGQ